MLLLRLAALLALRWAGRALRDAWWRVVLLSCQLQALRGLLAQGDDGTPWGIVLLRAQVLGKVAAEARRAR